MASIQEQLNALQNKLDSALLADRYNLQRQIKHLRRRVHRGNHSAGITRQMADIEDQLGQSVEIRRQRLKERPPITFDAQLPIVGSKAELVDAIARHQVLIVAGETGSGKSTQLPKFCLLAGRGVERRIGVTQPRRIAAMTVARRIAEELKEQLGDTVGFQIRFQETMAPHSRIKLMTDGILLAEIHKDPLLYQYDTLIVDEAHERSLNIDFILGIVKKILKRRSDLKLIITSATLDTEKFAAAFEDAPVFHVSGRLYDVETLYLEPDLDDDAENNYVEQAVDVVDDLYQQYLEGDILIFMPTEQDIRDCSELLQGRRYPNARIFALFARLSAAEQQKVFQNAPGRKIVVATNVAETSITIPGIRYVIDTGLARISQYAPRTRTTTLPVSPISRSSADQRCGRCGRVSNGVCFRLYSQADYEQRPRFTPPEIVRSNLAEVILRMTAMNLGKVQDFPFIDPPNPRSVQDGYNVLLELDAIKQSPSKDGYILTPKGRLMARLPLDPRLSCILLAAKENNCLDEAAVLTAALSIQDPRERPMEMQPEADKAHAAFSNPLSDFIALLKIRNAFQQIARMQQGWGQVRKFCRGHFLSFRRMREWQDVYRQILQVLSDHNIRPSQSASLNISFDEIGDIKDPWYKALHQSILSGFLSNIAVKKEKQQFQAAHQRSAMIFPGSGLFKNPGQWIVAAEMVETSRLFARCAAVIDPAWVVEIVPDLCTYSYLEPHWERRRGQVVATEQITFYGLPLLRRMRAFGPVEPEKATGIFIRQALIDGDVRQPLPFMEHNRQLIEAAQDMENRIRRRDILVDESQLEAFYHSRLDQVADWRTLKHLIRKAGGDGFLRFSEADILNYRPDDTALKAFPDAISAGPVDLACEYQFEPGHEHDGVTVQVPERFSTHIPAQSLEWLVPGLLNEKVTSLIKNLPKQYRRQLLPINQTVDTIVNEMPVQPQTALKTALSQFIQRRFGMLIPETVWRDEQLAEHLKMRIAVTDNNGKIIRAGRGAEVLQRTDRSTPTQDGLNEVIRCWERHPIQTWDFGDLDDSITLSAQPAKGAREQQWIVYPGLEVRPDGICLTAKSDQAAMQRAHIQGVRALVSLQLSKDIKHLKKSLALSAAYDAHCRYFGGRPAVEAQLMARVLDDGMAKNIRRQVAFDALVLSLKKDGLTAGGLVTRQCLIKVLDGYWNTRQTLFELEKVHANNVGAQALLGQARDMLTSLVPDNFIHLYDNARLAHLLRYLKAIAVRVQRGVLDLEKDNAKARQLEPFRNRLTELANALTPESRDEKKQAVESLCWMVEEFKISLFAQEVGTDGPISAKRLRRQIEQIEQMV